MTTMRDAFEACKVPAHPSKDQLKMADRIVKTMERQDANKAAAHRKRKQQQLHPAPAVSAVRE